MSVRSSSSTRGRPGRRRERQRHHKPAGAVSGQEGFWPDDDDKIREGVEPSRERGQDPRVERLKERALAAGPEHGELLPKKEVLGDENTTTS